MVIHREFGDLPRTTLIGFRGPYQRELVPVVKLEEISIFVFWVSFDKRVWRRKWDLKMEMTVVFPMFREDD